MPNLILFKWPRTNSYAYHCYSGYRDVLAGHPMVRSDQSLQKIIDGINDGTERMLDIVNNMLDVSKIDSQTLQVAFVPVLPRMLITETLGSLKKL